jgi:2-desacetyl-2-hydroxyethyl bacteriochlorophyllide A dehydrogenase
MSYRAVRIDAPGELRTVSVPSPEPGPGEAAVRVAAAGICGSDREVLHGTRPAPYVRYPVIPGHEWSGTVHAVGAGVDAGLVGRPVVGEGFRACLVCPACRRGDTNLCAGEYRETGFTDPGAWSDFLVLPARLLHTLPEGTDLRAAAGLEPAACVAAACLKAAAVPGERVAVVGAGMLGLLAVQLLAASGPAELVAVDALPERAEIAARCGATRFLSAADAGGDTWRGRFDLVLEAAGAPGTARLATTLAARGGRVVLTGLAAVEDVPLSPADLVLNALTVHTVFGAPSRAWTHVVRALAAGILDPGILVTHEFPLEDAAEAFRVLDEERRSAIKVLLHP